MESHIWALAARARSSKRPRSPSPLRAAGADDAAPPRAPGARQDAAAFMWAMASRVGAAAPVRAGAQRARLPRLHADTTLDGEAAIAATMAAVTARCRLLFLRAPAAATLKHWASAQRSFEAFCTRLAVPPLPGGTLHHDLVMAWLEDKCDDAENATSVEHWISHLYRSYETMNDTPAYSKTADGPFFARAKLALAKEYGVRVKRPLAITAAILRQIYERLRPDRDPRWRNFWVHLLAAYHWLLRPNEHLGADCVLRARDVTFSREGATRARVANLRVHASKGLRIVGAAAGEFEMTFTRETTGPLDLFSVLGPYLEQHNFASRPDDPLFPDLHDDGSPATGYMSMDSFNAKLRALLARAGLSTEYSARGLRSGRRSDLRNCGTPADVVCQLGRWKSEPTSFRYQRTAALIALMIRDSA